MEKQEKQEKQEVIKPVEGYLVIKSDTIEKTESGIYLSKELSKNLTQTGKVIKAGKGAPCKEGDTVVYQEWSGKEYKDHLILKFEDIMAVIEYV